MIFRIGKFSSIIYIVIIGWFTGCAASDIQSMESVMEKFKDGQFLAAAEEARKLDSVDGYVLAAEALIIYADHFAEDSERRQYLLEAIELARKAINRQPENPKVHIILIRGLGRYAQLLSPEKALSEGLAKKIRKNLDTLLALDPESWEAHLAYGFWHAEIVIKGGFPGMLLFNASRRKAIGYFDKAAELQQNSILLHLEIAQGLQLLEARKYRARIIKHLQMAIALPAGDAYASLLQNKAREILARLER